MKFDPVGSNITREEYRKEYKRIVEEHKKLMMAGKPQNRCKRMLAVFVPLIDARLRLLARYKGCTLSALLNYFVLNPVSLEDEEHKHLNPGG